MSTSFYTPEELSEIGFKEVGENVLISKFARIYKPEVISLASNIRIDDFCILSGGIGITIGNYVHISAYVALYGGGEIEIQDFASVTVRATIFSESDDTSGRYMMGVTIPTNLRGKVIRKKTTLYKHSGLGPHSVMLPGADLHEGALVYANSFVTKPREAWTISMGIPAKVIRKRKKEILHLEKKLCASLTQ